MTRPTYPERSPSGRRVVEPEGPIDAALVLVGESPAVEECEQGRPFVGRAGRVLDKLLVPAGIDRSQLRILNAVPCQAPGNQFDRHSEEDRAWGLELLARELKRSVARGAKLIVPLGDNPLELIAGPGLPRPPRWGEADGPNEKSRIGAWRGSLIPLEGVGRCHMATHDDLLDATRASTSPWCYALPTYHPAAISRRWQWHRDAIRDLKRARAFVKGEWEWPKRRTWHTRPPGSEWVRRIVEREHLVALDSEQEPDLILGLASEEAVYSFGWSEELKPLLAPLFESENVLVAAHNASHDLTFLRQLGFEPTPPYVDTGGLAHILCNVLPRSLSPGLSARFTTWPYHKHLAEISPLFYCAWDTVVCYDAYWSATERVIEEGLLEVSDHDHRLLRHCLAMQWRGIKVDEKERKRALASAEQELERAEERLRAYVEPVIQAKLDRFDKPHLFRRERQCVCCGGGSVKRQRCWSCEGFDSAPTKGEMLTHITSLYPPATVPEDLEEWLKADIEDWLLDPCQACNGRGERTEELEWKWDGPAINDILYRGFGIRPRRYKGRETRRADQVAGVLEKASASEDQKEAVRRYLDVVEADKERAQMEELRPDLDGRLHAQFDPWGTSSGRVASSSPLLQRGRNMQNIPRKYRNVLVADEGHVLFAPDMEQIEARCVAVLSESPKLREWFREPLDWPASPRHGTVDQHSQLQKLFHEKGIKLSRDQTKRFGYAATYGGEDRQLAIELTKDAHNKGEGVRVDAEDVSRIRRLFYHLLPGVREWQLEVSEEVARTRYVTSPTGRRRWWLGYITRNVKPTNLKPTDYVLREFTKNGTRLAQILDRKIQKEVWSYEPQDMAAWVLAEGLERLERNADREGLSLELLDPAVKAGSLIHVHDEVVIQVKASEIEEARRAIASALTLERWGMNFTCDVGEPARTWKGAKGSE